VSENDKNPQDFERRSREVLNEGAEALAADVRSRLTQARFKAVEEARKPATPAAWTRSLLPAGGLAAAVAVVLLAWNGLRPSVEGPPDDVGRSDALEIVAMADDYDLLENDVEFYQWLDSEPDVESVADLTGVG
jgi:hypothetical protein